MVLGNYIEFGIANITKPMTLLGAGSATTSWTLLNLFGAQPVIAVGNLNPGEQVAVVGFTVSSMAGSDAVAAGVSVQDCAGPVLFSDVVASGYLAASWSQVTRGVARVENSTSVTFEHCSFLATSNEPDFATAGLAVTNSLVHVTDLTPAPSSIQNKALHRKGIEELRSNQDTNARAGLEIGQGGPTVWKTLLGFV